MNKGGVSKTERLRSLLIVSQRFVSDFFDCNNNQTRSDSCGFSATTKGNAKLTAFLIIHRVINITA